MSVPQNNALQQRKSIADEMAGMLQRSVRLSQHVREVTVATIVSPRRFSATALRSREAVVWQRQAVDQISPAHDRRTTVILSTVAHPCRPPDANPEPPLPKPLHQLDIHA